MPNHSLDDAETVFRGRRYDVVAGTVRDQEGNPHRRELIVHPGAVVILPVLADGRFVMIRNERFATGGQLLELPAGTLEPGEDPDNCAGRELEEETGYRAGRIQKLTMFYTSPGICDERMYVYAAYDLVPTAQNLDAGEEITVELVDAQQAYDWARDGAIEDGKTLATLLYFHCFTDEKDTH